MNLLIIRRGGVGDLTMLSNSLKALKEQNPEINIHLATLKENIQLMKGVPFLEDVFPIEEIRKKRFDKIIDLRMAVEPPEIGNGKLDWSRYVSECRVDIFESLVGVKVRGEKRFEVFVNDEAHYKIKNLLGNLKNKTVGIQASAKSSIRAIPPGYIEPLCDRIIEKGMSVVLFGNTQHWSENLLKIQKKEILNLLNKTSLEEMIALCKEVDIIVGPDSSAVHLAGAFGKKCVALFGNIDPYTRVFYYPTVKALYPEGEMDCIPCWDIKDPCKVSTAGGSACMKLLSPERIIEAILEIEAREDLKSQDRRTEKTMSKAIAYFRNGLGNFIEMMQALQAVASMTDNNKIDIILDSKWQDTRRPAIDLLCRNWKTIERVINYPDRFNPGEYDFWFYTPHGSNDCNAVNIFKSQMHYRPVPKPNWRQSGRHESDHYEEIARMMGYQGEMPIVNFPLANAPVFDLPRPIIGLCNGYFRTSNHYWDAKEWPHFSRLSEVAKRYFGGSVVGVGLEGELPAGIDLAANFAGKLNILETAKVISQLDLLVTTDTGLMHLGDVLGIPLVALFGPTLTTKNAPKAKSSMILQTGISCSPCQDSVRWLKCKTNSCMQGITVGDVMAAAKEKLDVNRNYT